MRVLVAILNTVLSTLLGRAIVRGVDNSRQPISTSFISSPLSRPLAAVEKRVCPVSKQQQISLKTSQTPLPTTLKAPAMRAARAPSGGASSVARKMSSQGPDDASASGLDDGSALTWPVVKKSRTTVRKASKASDTLADETPSAAILEKAEDAQSQISARKRRTSKTATDDAVAPKPSPRKRKSSSNLAAEATVSASSLVAEATQGVLTSELAQMDLPATSLSQAPTPRKKSAKASGAATTTSAESPASKRKKAIVVSEEVTITSAAQDSSEPSQRPPAKAVRQKKVKVEKAIVQAAEPQGWREIYDLVVELRKERDAPVDWAGSESLGTDQASGEVDKFHTLLALMLSSQTKDQVVADAMRVGVCLALVIYACMCTVRVRLSAHE
jgi:hypothetical protein